MARNKTALQKKLRRHWAGVAGLHDFKISSRWIPAFAGMTQWPLRYAQGPLRHLTLTSLTSKTTAWFGPTGDCGVLP
jgi:hypothetical protein